MSETQAKSCPKCGSPMGIRLGELVCEACGYFLALNASGDEQKPSRGFVGKVAAPPSFGAGRRGIASYDQGHVLAHRRMLEKWIVISLTCLLMSIGNWLLNPSFVIESMPEYPLNSLVFVGLVTAALLALTLFIDWRLFKQIVFVLVCFAVLASLVLIFKASQLQTQLILYKLCVDELLLIWVANLLFRETARTR